MLIKHEIAGLVADAAARAQEEGDLPPLALPEVTVEHPAREEHGDYAASVAMKLARAARSDPLAVAEAIAKHIQPSEARPWPRWRWPRLASSTYASAMPGWPAR